MVRAYRREGSGPCSVMAASARSAFGNATAVEASSRCTARCAPSSSAGVGRARGPGGGRDRHRRADYAPTTAYHRPGNGLPIVLLPSTGRRVGADVAAVDGWAWSRPLYVLDTIGDPGRSVQQAPMPTRDDICWWLDDVLDHALALQRVRLGEARPTLWWAAVGSALHSPAGSRRRAGRTRPRQTATDVLDPRARVRHRIAVPRPVRRLAARPLTWPRSRPTTGAILRVGSLGQAKYRRGLPKFVPLTDDKVAAVRPPTLVLLGARRAGRAARRLARRLHTIAPTFDVESQSPPTRATRPPSTLPTSSPPTSGG